VRKGHHRESVDWAVGHTSEPYPAELLAGLQTLCHVVKNYTMGLPHSQVLCLLEHFQDDGIFVKSTI
jgi:hypothetical protein